MHGASPVRRLSPDDAQKYTYAFLVAEIDQPNNAQCLAYQAYV